MAKKTASPGVKEFFRKKLPPDVLEFFKKEGAKGGKLGGSKAWENLTPAERTARAKNAVAAREAKRKAVKKQSVTKRAPKKNKS